MSSEFIREERYIVFKISDLGNSLKGDEIRRLAQEYAEHRQRLGKKPLECVVVESDWPEYEPTWKAIEARVNAKPPESNNVIDIEAAEKDIALKERIIDSLGSALNAVASERGALRTELADLRSSMTFRTSLIGRIEAERDALQAKIEGMEKQEPVVEVQWAAGIPNGILDFISTDDYLPKLGDKLYAIPGAQGEEK